MAFRPTQMRASAAEAAMMMLCALASSNTYDELDMPTIISLRQNWKRIEQMAGDWMTKGSLEDSHVKLVMM